MELPSWVKKIASYAPDIGLAIATGGTSAIATTAMRIVAKEIAGDENAPMTAIQKAVEDATPEQLLALEKENNSFKVQLAALKNESKKIDNDDKQAEHAESQKTIRNGDNSDSRFVRYTRPGQAWLMLLASIAYVFTQDVPDPYILGVLLMIPFGYHGLRQVGKWKTANALTEIIKK